jgi:hypothetical protein
VVRGADLVVVGTVDEVRYELSTHDLPLTRVVLTLHRSLRGEVTSGRLLLGFPGGVHPEDGSVSIVPGVPELTIGDDVLVVGRAKTEDRAVPRSWSSGVLRAVTLDGLEVAVDGRGLLVDEVADDGTVVPLVVTDVDGAHAVAAAASDAAAHAPQALSFDAMVSSVEGYLAVDDTPGAVLGGFVATTYLEVVP